MTSEPPAAFVFDAYGTLFDVHSVAVLADELAPGQGAALSRAVARQAARVHVALVADGDRPGGTRGANFDDSPRGARLRACAALGSSSARDAQRRLCAAYLRSHRFPDARAALAALAPRPRWILSNGTQRALERSCKRAGWRRC